MEVSVIPVMYLIKGQIVNECPKCKKRILTEDLEIEEMIKALKEPRS